MSMRRISSPGPSGASATCARTSTEARPLRPPARARARRSRSSASPPTARDGSWFPVAPRRRSGEGHGDRAHRAPDRPRRPHAQDGPLGRPAARDAEAHGGGQAHTATPQNPTGDGARRVHAGRRQGPERAPDRDASRPAMTARPGFQAPLAGCEPAAPDAVHFFPSAGVRDAMVGHQHRPEPAGRSRGPGRLRARLCPGGRLGARRRTGRAGRRQHRPRRHRGPTGRELRGALGARVHVVAGA
jgi:hypothetical protein